MGGRKEEGGERGEKRGKEREEGGERMQEVR